MGKATYVDYCGHCGDMLYKPENDRLQARIAQLEAIVDLVRKMCALPIVGFSKQRDMLAKLRVLLRELP